jgi:hypothetical protein
MFSAEFADLVERGEKCQTIRPTPKRVPQPGDIISLRCWTGKPYRSKQRVLKEGVVTKTIPVQVNESGVLMCGLELHYPDAFARADGFEDMPALVEWFRATYGLPFSGVMISWHNVERMVGCKPFHGAAC